MNRLPFNVLSGKLFYVNKVVSNLDDVDSTLIEE